MSKEAMIIELVSKHLQNKHHNLDINTVDTTQSLLNQGLLDSMDFIGLLMDIETSLSIDIDFEDQDPSLFTSIDGLLLLAAACHHE